VSATLAFGWSTAAIVAIVIRLATDAEQLLPKESHGLSRKICERKPDPS